MSEPSERLRQHLETLLGVGVKRATGQQGNPAATVRGRQPGGSAPGNTVPDTGQGRLTDPTTGTAYFILGVDTFDDTTKHF
ncbi:MAG: hypothetical protein ACYDCO_27150 [Armatimonadota bacterium]